MIGSDREKGLFIWWVGDPLVTVSYPAGVPEVVDTGGEAVIVQVDELAAGDLLAGSAALHYDLGAAIVDLPLVPLAARGETHGALSTTWIRAGCVAPPPSIHRIRLNSLASPNPDGTEHAVSFTTGC